LEEVRRSATAVPEQTADGSNWLFASSWAPASGELLLWLEADAGRLWSAGEAAALALAAQAFARLAGTAEARLTPWAQALERARGGPRLQDRLEDAARLTGKLAHDFGNVLTGILGFTELSLSQIPADALPHRYVKEVWQAAHQGAQWIQKLQQFSRRRAATA